MAKKLTVWKAGECDWVIASSAKEVHELLASVSMELEDDDEVRPCTDAELDTLMFLDDPYREDTTKRTFREELNKRLADGLKDGDMFATTEF
jgi:uncharacterized protein YabE (DUF348 family)